MIIVLKPGTSREQVEHFSADLEKRNGVKVNAWYGEHSTVLGLLGDTAGVDIEAIQANELVESAQIDGASDWRIFHQVVLPMSRNSIAALAIFTFLWNWEDYLWPFLMITDDDKQLLSVGLKMFSGQYGTDYGGLFAATSVTIIPVVIVYLVFQKQFIAGIATGSGK